MKLAHGVFTPALRESRLKAFRVIAVVHNACLELVHVGKGRHELLDFKKHEKILKRENRPCDAHTQDPQKVFELLQLLMHSPLNKAGYLLIYVATQNSQLLEINPQLEPFSDFHQFESIMCCLLLRRSIRAKTGEVTLLRIVKNNLAELLPPNTRKLELTCASTDLNSLFAQHFETAPLRKQPLINDNPFVLLKVNSLAFFLNCAENGAHHPEATEAVAAAPTDGEHPLIYSADALCKIAQTALAVCSYS